MTPVSRVVVMNDSISGYEMQQSVNRPGGFGGYILPSTSSEGPQVHRCSLGTLSMTEGICFPHPHQETFSARDNTLTTTLRRRHG
jgi:hypothetical protein